MTKEYREDVARLKLVLATLEKRVRLAESRLTPFLKLTADCGRALSAAGGDCLVFYLKQWFRAFLGIKDECMVLINGEIIRQYHAKMNEPYIHDRGKEAHFYNADCSLSLCSVDGVDFEYRRLVKRFGHKNAFDALADTSERLSSALHQLAKSIDQSFQRIEAATRSIPGCKLVSDFKHCGEIIEIFQSVGARKVTLSNVPLRKCSQAAALTTVLEEAPDALPPAPPDASSLSASVVASTAAAAAASTGGVTQGSKRAKRRLDLVDSDEEESAAATKLPPSKPDFSFTASLEQIKSMYSLREADEGEVVAFGTGEDEISGSLAEALEDADDARDAAIEVEGMPPIPSISFRCKAFLPDLSPVLLSIELLAPHLQRGEYATWIARQQPPLVDVSSLLDEAIRRLWLRRPLLSTFPVPRAIQVGSVKWTRGQQFPLPDLAGKRFPLLLDTHPQAAALLLAVRAWCAGDGIGERWERQLAVWRHKDLVLSAAAFTRRRSVAASSDTVDDATSWHYDCQCRCHCCPATAVDGSQMERRERQLQMCGALKRAVLHHLGGGVKVRLLSPADDLSLLCQCCATIDASHALIDAACLQALQVEGDTADVQVLDLTFNPLFCHLEEAARPRSWPATIRGLADALDAAAWRDPLVDGLALLFDLQRLRELRLHAKNATECGIVLAALWLAKKRREQSGAPPLRVRVEGYLFEHSHEWMQLSAEEAPVDLRADVDGNPGQFLQLVFVASPVLPSLSSLLTTIPSQSQQGEQSCAY